MTTQLKPTVRPRLHPDLVFWGCYFLLNILLFLPFYLLNLNEDASQQIWATLRHAPLTALFNLFIWRDDSDPFRINVELIVLVALWVNVGWLRRGVVRWLITIAYFVALIYYGYESIMMYLYHAEPIFYSHYFLIRDGLKFLTDHLSIPLLDYVGVFGAAFLIIGAIIFLLTTLTSRQLPSQVSRATHIAVTAIALAVLLSAFTYRGVSADPRMVMSSLSFKLEKNISASISLYNSIINFDDAEIYRTYNYSTQHLTKKPNIYLLFVESYGSVLYKRPDWKPAYLAMLKKETEKLDKAGFHFASKLSESPTWGGGSWLAYTSGLFGMHISSQPQYLAIMDRYETKVPRYPDIGTYFRSQGYDYFWTTAISEQLSDRKWNTYKAFYGPDEWFRFDDLNYTGSLYGWGPVPPDQYTLNYARDVGMAGHSKPLLMFLITQNTHFPFQPLPELADDWHDLNTPLPSGDPVPLENVGHDELRAEYLKAVQYELEMLTDFILNHSDEDAVFYLLGDHQPPSVSRRSDTYYTPLHIVSHDQSYIDNLGQYGFTKGLVVDDSLPSELHHAGLYSLIVRTLVQTYGSSPSFAPPYLPDGVAPPGYWVEAADEETK